MRRSGRPAKEAVRSGVGACREADDRLDSALHRHLHTHVAVADLAHARSDDRWSALDGRDRYSWCRSVGFPYAADLRAEFTRRLGVT